jgi:hypothetical protein
MSTNIFVNMLTIIIIFSFRPKPNIRAHGEITVRFSEADFKTIILFTITVLIIYKEFIDEGKA